MGYGDLYRDWNSNPSLRYSLFYVVANQSQSVSEFDRYSFNLFVADRLENEDGDNVLQVQSISKELLDNIVLMFCNEYNSEVFGTVYYQPFTQQFADLLAGTYMTITLQIPKDMICPDE